MRCSEFHERVNDLMDDHQDPTDDRLVQQHARTCQRCRAELVGYQAMQQFFVPHTTIRSPKPHRPRSLTMIGCLASVAVVLWFIAFSANPESAENAMFIAQSSPTQPIAIQPVGGIHSVLAAENVREPRGNVVQPILGLSLVAKTNWANWEAVEMPFGMQVPQVETQWLQAVADEMQPVRQSVDSTVNLILRTLSS